MADLHSKILNAPPRGVQILSISCSFWEILPKSYVGAPPGELAPPPRGNLGSAGGGGGDRRAEKEKLLLNFMITKFMLSVLLLLYCLFTRKIEVFVKYRIWFELSFDCSSLFIVKLKSICGVIHIVMYLSQTSIHTRALWYLY